MRILRENTATRISVGPFLDVTDGITPEVALTVTGIHLTLMVDDAGVPTLSLDADATASGGANDMVHVTNDDAGMYDLELAAANVNFTGRALLACIDTSEHLPVFHEFQIVSANVYDAIFTDGDVLDVSVTQLGGVAQSLTDLKDFADAGYDPSVNKVEGVKLVDTTTTNTDLISAATIGNAVWDTDATGRQTAGTFGQAIGDPAANAETIYDAVVTDAAGTNVAVDVVAVKSTADAIETDTGAIETDTINIQSRLPDALVAGNLKTNVLAIDGSTGAADYLQKLMDSGVSSTTNDAGASATVFITNLSEATNDHYKGRLITFTDGVLAGQQTDITGYAGATKTLTVTALTEAPGNGDAFVIH